MRQLPLFSDILFDIMPSYKAPCDCPWSSIFAYLEFGLLTREAAEEKYNYLQKFFRDKRGRYESRDPEVDIKELLRGIVPDYVLERVDSFSQHFWMSFGLPSEQYVGPFERETDNLVVEFLEYPSVVKEGCVDLELRVWDKKLRRPLFGAVLDDEVQPENLYSQLEPRLITLLRRGSSTLVERTIHSYHIASELFEEF